MEAGGYIHNNHTAGRRRRILRPAEESVDGEDWQAGCDPHPSAEDSLIPSLINDPSASELVCQARNRYGIQSINPEDEESESKRVEPKDWLHCELRSWTKES